MLTNLFFEISAMYIKNAIKKEIIAIERFDRRILTKKFGKNNFIRPPKTTNGTVPIKIDLESLFLKKDLIFNF